MGTERNGRGGKDVESGMVMGDEEEEGKGERRNIPDPSPPGPNDTSRLDNLDCVPRAREPRCVAGCCVLYIESARHAI